MARSERAAVLCAATSAIAAAAHEVIWSRAIGRAVGNTAVGVALALALMMVGMGAGALLAPRIAWLWRRPARSIALVEIALAAGALALSEYCLRLAPASAIARTGDPAGLALDLIAVSVLASIPAIAMGMTYPLLVRAVPTALSRLYRAGLWGAVGGTFLCALVLAPRLGLEWSAVLAAIANLAAAVLAWRRLGDGESESIARDDRGAIGPLVRFAAAAALGLGAQVVWNRCLVPYAGVSIVTFAAIVFAYLLAQAIGFAIHPRLREPSIGALALLFAAAYAIAALGLLDFVPALVPDRNASAIAWVFGVVLATFIVVAPPAILLGIAQADAIAELRSAESAGRVVGAGTMISALGALLAAILLVPYVGPRWTLAILGMAAPAALLFGRDRQLVPIALAAIAVALARPGPRFFLGPEADRAETLFATFDVQDTTAVVVADLPAEPRIRHLVANGVSYSGDSRYAQRYMRLLAHLPAAVAPGRDRALLICVGTGTTLDALRTHRFARIDAVDLAPSLRHTLSFFGHAHHGAIGDPRVRLIEDDGARYIRRSADRYDLITLEPPPPRAPGASSLYSVDFYRAARAHLNRDGALAQWLPLHGLSADEAYALVHTMAAAFDRVSLHLVERNEAVLIAGGAEPRLPSTVAARRDLASIGWRQGGDPYADTFTALASDLPADAPIVRDAWPMPEYAPLAGAGGPLDELLDRLPQPDPSHRDAFLLRAAAPAFVRTQENRARSGDRERVRGAMIALLRRDPRDPYWQHAFGYGPLLEARLERVGPELTPAQLDRARAIQRRARESTLRMLGSP